MTSKKTFQGTSNTGDLQEAFDHAILAAQNQGSVSDDVVNWSLTKVSGRRGGIQGTNRITVTIAVDGQ